MGWGRKSPGEVEAALVGLVDRVTGRMRAADRVGRTITLRLRFEDFARVTRSQSMVRATARTAPILAVARRLLEQARPLIEARGITLVGISVANLDDDDAVQLTLPFDKRIGGSLDVAIDDLRDRFGSTAVTRAVLLGRDPGMTVPLLPD